MSLKKEHFGLVKDPAHFQQIINEIPKGIPFAFRYLDDILVFNEN